MKFILRKLKNIPLLITTAVFLIALIGGIFYLLFSIDNHDQNNDETILYRQLVLEGWEVMDLSGNVKSVGEICTDKPIFINIWASWSYPCIYEMPGIQKLYDKYKNSVTFLCLSDEKLKTLNQFIDRHQYNIPIYQFSSLPKGLKTETPPTTFILSKNHTIEMGHVGYKNWDQQSIYNFLDGLK